ncbi:hypothetical protein F2Q68_00039933 [Brassica cretica]|uniref:Uncharacterized protein n=1 Tax=Brassica cretica TaxID=69181 RepID=A0A8S9MKH8_BRACR|nr:hypothetical protein F2Q68_00039933 [Brassica cretica]
MFSKISGLGCFRTSRAGTLDLPLRGTRSCDLVTVMAMMARGGGSTALSPPVLHLETRVVHRRRVHNESWWSCGRGLFGGRVVAVSLWFWAFIFRGFKLVLSSIAVTASPPLMLFACCAKRTELGSLVSGHGIGQGFRSSLMGSPFSGEIFTEYPSQCSDCRWSSWQDTLSLFFAGIEDPVSAHAFPAARLVGGCVAPVLLAVYGVLSSMSFN